MIEIKTEIAIQHTMRFSCQHSGSPGSQPSWIWPCVGCGEKVNWSPKLKAWMSADDWKEHRRIGRLAAGLEPDGGIGLIERSTNSRQRNG